MRKPHSVSEAIVSRDSFAKALYDRLFTYIVSHVNSAIDPSLVENAGHIKSTVIGKFIWSTRPAQCHGCSDHYFHTCPAFHNLKKYNKVQVKIVIAVSLASGIIADISFMLVLNEKLLIAIVH